MNDLKKPHPLILVACGAVIVMAISVSYYLLVIQPRNAAAALDYQRQKDAATEQQARDRARNECLAKESNPATASLGRLSPTVKCDQYLK